MIDNIPIIEYNHYLVLTDLPKDLFWTGSFPDWSPSCFENNFLKSELSLLDNYLSLVQAVYSSDSYTRIGFLASVILPIKLPLGEKLPPATSSDLIRPMEVNTYDKLIDSYGALKKMIGPEHLRQ